jgi:hypothetical protein
MALVRTLDPTALSFLFSDNNGNRASAGLYLPSAADAGDVDAFVTATRGPLLALTDARLDGANANFVYVEDAPIAAPASSEVERKLVLIFRTANRRQRVKVEVPSPIFGLEQPGTDAVSLTDPLVVALANQIISGPIGANNGAVTVNGGDIIALERAYISHRNRRANA